MAALERVQLPLCIRVETTDCKRTIKLAVIFLSDLRRYE